MCLRELAYIAAGNGFQLKAVHLEGILNEIPDWLSRYVIDKQCRKKFRQWNNIHRLHRAYVDSSLFQFNHDW